MYKNCYFFQSQLAYSSGRFVYLWSLSDNKLVYKFKGHEDRYCMYHYYYVYNVHVCPESAYQAL